MALTAPQATAQIGLPGATTAPEPATLPDPLTPEAANALISRLSDGEVRALLLDQLNTQAAAEAQATDNGPSEFFHHATTGAVRSITLPIERLPLLFSRTGRSVCQLL